MSAPENRAEVVVVGAGPAGIAAATAAAGYGRRVLLLDDNPAPGGQIWRGGFAASSRRAGGEDAAKRRALDRLERSGAQLLGGARVYASAASGTIDVLREDAAGTTSQRIEFGQLILATGARERFLPFPGWTQPGVFGAGGLQALVKGGYPVRGRRVLVAGTGPLLLAVAAHLRAYGAHIVAIAEQAPLRRLLPFAASLWSHPGKIWQGMRYRASLARSPFHTGCWPVAATPAADGLTLRSVRLANGRRSWEQPCDLLACGFHLVANTELAALLGCVLNDGLVAVDADQRTSVPGIFAVGEPTGIAGLEAAMVQGSIAGSAAAGKSTAALQARARSERRFAMRLERAFALRPELRSLAAPDTVVCRCEDVTRGRLDGHSGWTDAKLQTRCGMGPCQGRICGPAVEFLLGWTPGSVRPPIFPVPLGVLGTASTASKENA